MINNTALIVGTVFSEPQYDHTVMDEKFYLFYVSSMRRSNIPDVLPVIISEKLLESNIGYLGMRVELKGSFRSHNLHKDGRSYKLLFIFTEYLKLTDQMEDVNEISLEGHLCRQAVYRETPLGRQISDINLAVNRPFGKSDYIPVLMWARNAVVVSTLPVGSCIKISGRMQSRWYQKKLEDGQVEDRCCYEVSAYWMEQISSSSGGVSDAEYCDKEREQDQILQ
jgi:single-stranded DNA-binding protein